LVQFPLNIIIPCVIKCIFINLIFENFMINIKEPLSEAIAGLRIQLDKLMLTDKLSKHIYYLFVIN